MAAWWARVLILIGTLLMTIAGQTASAGIGMFALSCLAAGTVLGMQAFRPRPRGLLEALAMSGPEWVCDCGRLRPPGERCTCGRA
jgi:hypothetical protein